MHLRELAEVIIPDFSQAMDLPGYLNAIFEQVSSPRFNLVGHAMGGWVALELMKLFPQRVEKLALIATTASADTWVQKAQHQQMLDRFNQQSMPEIFQQLANSMVHDMSVMSEVYAMFKDNQHLFTHQMRALMNRQDNNEALSRIPCPTLLVHGRYDKRCDKGESNLMTKRLIHAKEVTIEEVGHMVPMERPEALSALLSYWLQ